MWRALLFLLICLPGVPLLAGDVVFPIDEINQTLNYIAIDTSDIRFRPDRVELDSFRLPLINYLTEQPLQIPSYLKKQGDFLLSDSVGLDEICDSLAEILVGRQDLPEPESRTGNRFYDEAHKAGGVTRQLAERLERLLAATAGSRTEVQSALDRTLSVTEQAFLQDSFFIFLMEEEEGINRPEEELDSLQRLHDSLALRFKEIGHRVPLAEMLRSQQRVVTAATELADWLRAERKQLQSLGKDELERCFPDWSSDGGMITIGGRGNDYYDDEYAVIIEIGGDDEYHFSKSVTRQNQIIIDLSGADEYYGEADFTLGAALLGCGILIDDSGADIYSGGNFSLGCGLFGIGLLRDGSGDDYYRGDICSQAAAAFGVGVLRDVRGRDTYTARIFSQGFGFIMGCAALVDHAGNDMYTVGWKYGDILRYENHYLSLSQGFGYGLRPHFSGGVGLMIDGDGHDIYNADIFGQGASYWYALGGLLDYSGTDRYVGYQYTQGAATHLCLAALIDLDGPDLYSAKGVSQGCGHDLAFGLLLDCGGDDQYHAYDLSQAAGSANGVGMLVDLKGNDGYLIRSKANTHGYGNPRRDYGSIGLFLDLQGADLYNGYGQDNSYWVTDSKWGIGADLEVADDH